MKNTPINYGIVNEILKNSSVKSVGNASIREVKKLIDEIESATGEKFIRMEMGIPGLPPVQIGIEAEKEALDKGIPAIYPDIFGIYPLKNEIKRFAKLFLNLEINVEGCIPTVGSMQGSFASFMTLNRMHADREGTLFIDPGFPVHKQQLRVMGQDHMAFDVYNYRGDKLKDKLVSYLKSGKVSTILYSNPNNPSWI
jgi:aspartate/methionine/tyrosine aminotransferase